MQKKKVFSHVASWLWIDWAVFVGHFTKETSYVPVKFCALHPTTAAAFVPTPAVEEALQKCYQVLRWKIAGVSDTENRLRSCSHMTPTGKIV